MLARKMRVRWRMKRDEERRPQRAAEVIRAPPVRPDPGYFAEGPGAGEAGFGRAGVGISGESKGLSVGQSGENAGEERPSCSVPCE